MAVGDVVRVWAARAALAASPVPALRVAGSGVRAADLGQEHGHEALRALDRMQVAAIGKLTGGLSPAALALAAAHARVNRSTDGQRWIKESWQLVLYGYSCLIRS